MHSSFDLCDRMWLNELYRFKTYWIFYSYIYSDLYSTHKTNLYDLGLCHWVLNVRMHMLNDEVNVLFERRWTQVFQRISVTKIKPETRLAITSIITKDNESSLYIICTIIPTTKTLCTPRQNPCHCYGPLIKPRFSPERCRAFRGHVRKTPHDGEPPKLIITWSRHHWKHREVNRPRAWTWMDRGH